MPSGVEGIAERLGVPTYRICYSGAYVTGPDGAQIASQTLPLEVAREVLGVMSSLWPWLAPSYFAGPHWFAEDPRRPRRPGRGGRRAGAARAGELRRAARRGSRAQQAVLPRGLPPRARRGDTPPSSPRASPSSAVILSTNGKLVEVIRSDVSKATGARALLDALGVPMGRALAFGDDENDVPLLSAAGHGVAMGNASRRVRSCADEVGPTNDDDGVAVVLERLLAQG